MYPKYESIPQISEVYDDFFFDQKNVAMKENGTDCFALFTLFPSLIPTGKKRMEEEEDNLCPTIKSLLHRLCNNVL